MTSTASIGGHPIHAIRFVFPVALFATVLLIDLENASLPQTSRHDQECDCNVLSVTEMNGLGF